MHHVTLPHKSVHVPLRMGQRHRLQHSAHVPQHGAPLRAGEVSGRRRSGTRSGASGASSHGYSGAGGKRTKRHSDLGGSFGCLIKGRVFQIECIWNWKKDISCYYFPRHRWKSETFARVFLHHQLIHTSIYVQECWYEWTDISWNILITYVDTSSMLNAGAKPTKVSEMPWSSIRPGDWVVLGKSGSANLVRSG